MQHYNRVRGDPNRSCYNIILFFNRRIKIGVLWPWFLTVYSSTCLGSQPSSEASWSSANRPRWLTMRTPSTSSTPRLPQRRVACLRRNCLLEESPRCPQPQPQFCRSMHDDIKTHYNAATDLLKKTITVKKNLRKMQIHNKRVDSSLLFFFW